MIQLLNALAAVVLLLSGGLAVYILWYALDAASPYTGWMREMILTKHRKDNGWLLAWSLGLFVASAAWLVS